MKLKKTHFAVAALVAGSLYALTTFAFARNTTYVDTYSDSSGNVVGQRIVYDGCNSGLANWGTTSSFRKRTASTCPDPGPNAEF